MGESYPYAEMQSEYSEANTLGGSYPSVEMQSVYSAVPADWDNTLGGSYSSFLILMILFNDNPFCGHLYIFMYLYKILIVFKTGLFYE